MFSEEEHTVRGNVVRVNIKRGNKVERILDHGFSVCHQQKGGKCYL